MKYLDKEFIRKVIAVLAILWFSYLLKLYFIDNAIGARLAALLAWLYALFVPIVFALLDRLFEIESPISKVTKKHRRIEEPKKLIDKLRMMHPKDFEDFIKLLFELKWYKVIYKSFWKKYFWSWFARKDWWIDLIALKDGNKSYIQIKKYITNMVSVNDVRSFYGAIVSKIKSWDKVIFITTSVFSEDAEKFAKENNILIVTHKELVEEIKSIQNKQAINDFLSKMSYYSNKYNQNIRTCPKCWAPLKWRKEGFYGCQNYIKWCKYTEKY